MNEILDKPLSYDNQKYVFQHLNFLKRKELRSNYLRKKQREVFDDSQPYHFSKLNVDPDDNGNIRVAVNNRDYIGKHCSWEFSNGRVTRKFSDLKETFSEQAFDTEKTAEESAKQFLEFYLNRNSTRIGTLDINVIPAGLDLTAMLSVKTLIISVESDVTNFISHIRPQLEELRFGPFVKNLPSCDTSFTAKKVSCYLYEAQQFDWVHRLNAVDIELKTDYYENDEATIINFLKEFALRTRSIKSQLSWKGEHDNFEPILSAIRDDSATGWAKKFLYKRECATLTADDHEVNICDAPPPKTKMRFDLAFKIFSRLPYPSREKIVRKHWDWRDLTKSPINAENVHLECTNDTILKAIIDGEIVKDIFYMRYCLLRGCYVKNMSIKGAWDGTYIRDLRVDKLILDSQEPFPQTLASIFMEGHYPKVIFANNPETIRNIREITENAEVTFTDTMASDEAADEPSVKRARVE